MKSLQLITDKTAIAMSLACSVHYLLLPIALVMLPSLSVLPLGGERFHFWIVVGVVPLSVYALTLGCKQHKHFQLLAFGGAGIACLVAGVTVAEAALGELGEKMFTVIGSGLIAYGHFRNYRLCQKQQCVDSCGHGVK